MGRAIFSGYPAHAGIDLLKDLKSIDKYRLPRTRGDRPQRLREAQGRGAATPHTRGSTAEIKVGQA